VIIEPSGLVCPKYRSVCIIVDEQETKRKQTINNLNRMFNLIGQLI
jgi:hypothetical protein